MDTIRIAPPLVTNSDQVDWALEGVGTTLRQDYREGNAR